VDVHVGDCLRLRREQLNLDIGAVAKRVNVSPATLEDYEDGSQRPPAATLIHLMNELGLKPTELFGSFVPG
jgi:transcriptional regulator with XRE-family HTH domain